MPPAPLPRLNAMQILQASVPLWVLTAAPALAVDADFSQGSASQGSYYATLFLFVSTIPGTAGCLIAIFQIVVSPQPSNCCSVKVVNGAVYCDCVWLHWSATALLLLVSCQQHALLAFLMAAG